MKDIKTRRRPRGGAAATATTGDAPSKDIVKYKVKTRYDLLLNWDIHLKFEQRTIDALLGYIGGVQARMLALGCSGEKSFPYYARNPALLDGPKTCETCSEKFGSRNMLFSHLERTGHAVDVPRSLFLVALADLDTSADRILSLLDDECVANSVDSSTFDSGATPIHIALERCIDDAVEYTEDWVKALYKLIRLGCDPNKKTSTRRFWGRDESRIGASAFDMLKAFSTKTYRSLFKALLDIGPEAKIKHCEICMDEFIFCETKPALPPGLYKLRICGHETCKFSMSRWFETQVTDGRSADAIRCPLCHTTVSWDDLRELLPAASIGLLERRELEIALLKIPGFVWCPICPSGGIMEEKALRQTIEERGGCPDVECAACAYSFCTKCREPGHLGMDCESARKDKNRTWFRKFVKACPKCKAPISRNGGCSHMTCSKCRFEFCWVCLKKYSGKYTFQAKKIDSRVARNNSCPVCGPTK